MLPILSDMTVLLEFVRALASVLAPSYIASRGISLEEADLFEWESAVIIPDMRLDYGEPRYRTFGLIDNVSMP